MSVSLADLTDVVFAETDTDAVLSEIITTYEALTGKALYDGDPVRLFLSTLASVIVQQRSIIQFTGRQNLLLYATGDYLDQLGALTDTGRIPATNATATIQFSISEALAFSVPIPAGSRVTPDGTLVFATDAYAEIVPGETVVDVPATCTTVGTIGNGFVAGQINRMIDPLAYIDTAANTTTSDGGADIEDDDSFRERIQLSPERFSVAGPIGAYRFWAQSASSLIIDVAVYSPEAGRVTILPLLSGGSLPGAEVLSAVEDVVNDRSVRPLTDQVTVSAPTAVPYNLDITYYIGRDSATLATTIQAAVQSAVADYLDWQKTSIGRDINPSQLIGRVQAAGAKRVVVTEPSWQVLERWQVAQDNTVSITYGGLEEE